jgi:hypothetical protein
MDKGIKDNAFKLRCCLKREELSIIEAIFNYPLTCYPLSLNIFGNFFPNPYFCTPKSNRGFKMGYGVKVAQQILILFV